ncbi:quinone-dependent dihydroorotate dehydrogenase [Minwuia thermotolerans]|uniref:Dihydroorotate dehydrogenase (quinone) n=1 Tax=Minwuia thermotolerans TaxID=2056226 RepID=A0A2M9G5K8_9PROT|nr:quinone-dependent dihydroorotate dehydrogenase [Minwuia thermotolerans]PJK31009.1 dihydroorotate dehydrogenase (quinone) [Minwuia thermotolerans]
MFPYPIVRPLLFALDAERAHRLTLGAIRLGLAGRVRAPGPPVRIGGLTLANPVGLAAGFDKDAEAVDGLLRMGFGFIEVGGVTPRPQPGNKRPRVFRLAEDRAVINRYGLNSAGAEAVARNLEKRRAVGVVGVNLGANKESEDRIGDYAECLTVLGGLADFATVNVSSPNTPGLRALQGKAALTGIFDRLHRAQSGGRATPLFLKLAPDLTAGDMDDIAEVIDDLGVAALVISNTTVARPEGLRGANAGEAGGLSGAPLMPLSTAVLRAFHERLEGRVPLIGVGGILSGDDAVAKLEAGASAVQVYTGLIYRGPALIGECAEAIAAHRS